VNLRELCLINTPGLVVPDLSFARYLTRVTLTDQRLVSLTDSGAAGLGDLPHLRELYLQNNQLENMDGISGCTGLHKLWLCSNQLRQLECLGQLQDLRELWLQDNKFEDMSAADGPGLSACINLQVLALAGNPLTACESLGLTTLSTLPALHDLSFADPMFGASPVVRTNGYRDSVIMQCRQVQMLDGVRVTGGARAAAEDSYLRSVLEFNARIDGIRQTAAADAAAAERRMLRNQEAHEAHKAALTREWEQLVASVARAQHDMAAARDDLLATTATRRAELQAQAVELTRQYEEVMGRQMKLTEAALTAEDQRLERMEDLLTLLSDFEDYMSELAEPNRRSRPEAPAHADRAREGATDADDSEPSDLTWMWVALHKGSRGFHDAVHAWTEAAGVGQDRDRGDAGTEVEVVAAYRLDCCCGGNSAVFDAARAAATADRGTAAHGEEWVSFVGSACTAEALLDRSEGRLHHQENWDEVKTVVSQGWRGWVDKYARRSSEGASSDEAGVDTPLTVYRRLPASKPIEREAPVEGNSVTAEHYPRSTVVVLARLCIEGGRAVQLEAADVDYLEPSELAESAIPADADWGAIEAGEEGGAYLLLAAHSHASAADVDGGCSSSSGEAAYADPASSIAGLQVSYCVLLAERGLLDEAPAATDSGAASGGASGLGWGLSPAVEAECAAIEAKAAALEQLAVSQWQQ
jgi:hypothetical protein